jgi:hypothetical protein
MLLQTPQTEGAVVRHESDYIIGGERENWQARYSTKKWSLA